MALTRYVLLAVGAAMAACSAFGGSDVSVAAVDEGGVGHAADAAAGADAEVVLDAAIGSSDAATDAGRKMRFCDSPPTGTVFCADFDESPGVDAGWFEQDKKNGTVSLVPTPGGSAPNALRLETAMGGVAYADTRPLALSAFANKHLMVRLRFAQTMMGTTNLATLTMGKVPLTVSITATGQLSCVSPAGMIAPGSHELLVKVLVDGTGAAIEISCSLDGAAPTDTTTIITAPGDLVLELGERASANATSIAVDDVVVYTAP